MGGKLARTSALIWALLCVLPARGQEPIPTPPQLAPADGDAPVDGLPSATDSDAQSGPAPATQPLPGLSDWITYNRNGCCSGPVGNALPLMTELFLRSGVAVPLPNTAVGKNLNTGWEIEGGGRLMLFNPIGTRAWLAEASVSTQENWNNGRFMTFPLNVIVPASGLMPARRVHFGEGKEPGVAIRGLNRTFANLGGGREWYLIGSALAPGRKLRIGVDGGGRWGSAKMDLTHLPHRTDTIGGLYTAATVDVEVPCAGACVFYTGLRTEWDYTFMDILQRKSDIMGINALVTAGVRW